MNNPKFEPFMDRLSRDIRNDLSESLVDVIKTSSLAPAQRVADSYLETSPASCYVDYIEDRIQRYGNALTAIENGSDDPLYQGLVLWDNGLFFEVHEVLEHAWLKAEGNEKLFLQGMIRAAGVYIKMEHGYIASARKIADKAIPVLESEAERLIPYTDPAVLIQALRKMETAPKLLCQS